MGRVLLLDPERDFLRELTRDRRWLGERELTQTMEPTAFDEALASDDVDLIVIGPNADSPISAVQRIHQRAPATGVMIIRADDLERTQEALRFAPFVGEHVVCRVLTNPATHREELATLIERSCAARRQRTVLERSNRSLERGAPPSPTPDAEYLDQLLDYAPMGVAALDGTGAIIEWNRGAARLTGRHVDEVTGRTLAQVFQVEELEHALADASGVPALFEWRTGTDRRFIELTVTAARSRAGARGLLAMFSDVTPRVEAEEVRKAALEREQDARIEAEQALHWRHEFLSVAAHELRTPLTGLKGYAQLAGRALARSEPDVEQTRRHLGRLNDEVSRYEQLVEDLLDVSRIEHGRLSLEEDWVDLSALAREVVEQLRYAGERTARHAVFVETPAAVVGRWDGLRLRQVLMNLVSNALRFSPQGGHVHVAVALAGEHARLTVADEGVGIPAEEVDRIFEPFVRSSTGAAIPGTGLGLYISSQIIRLHGGEIHAEANVGGGSIFTVRLPLVPADTEQGQGE